MRIFLRQLRPALTIAVVFTVICGIAYPLLSTAIGATAFRNQAEGSLIKRNGMVIGSELIGQRFAAPQYFHGRPSAAGTGYDASASSGSNLGPLNADLLAAVADRVRNYRAENELPAETPVPVDAVTASGSGLDPHISPANARLQAPRVAEARGMNLDDVLAAIDASTDGRALAVLGEPGVNVVQLNVSLDYLGS